jgi:hypothetical protein
VSLEEALAILAALVLMAGDGKVMRPRAGGHPSRLGLERPCETHVAWAREA